MMSKKRDNKIGKMDRRIEILGFTETQSGYGSPVRTWSTIAKRWGHVDFKPGKEKYDGLQEKVFEPVAVQMYHYDLSAEKHRLKIDGEEYDVLSVYEIERQRFIEVKARQVS